MNLQQVADKLGVSTKTVSSWVRKGCPHVRRKSGTYHFKLHEVQQWRAATLMPRPSAAPSTYAEARARKETAMAGLRELQLKVRTGELVTKESVRAATFDVNRRTRDTLYNLPPRVSGILAAETDQDKIYAILMKEIAQIMEELSGA